MKCESCGLGPADGVTIHRELALADLRECAHNPRKHYDEEAMRELVASVSRQGVVTWAASGRPVGVAVLVGQPPPSPTWPTWLEQPDEAPV